MSGSTFGALFRVTNFGESHGPAIGCVIDGCPPGMALSVADIQPDLDRRRPGTSRHVTQRQEADQVEILSGVYEGLSTGTPICLLIRNTDQRSKDYANLLDTFRPGHADIAYELKYGIRDYRGGGRSSARETAMRVAAGAIARKVLGDGVRIRGALVAMGGDAVDRAAWDWAAVDENDFFCPDRAAAARWEEQLLALRKSGNSVGAVIEVVAEGVFEVTVTATVTTKVGERTLFLVEAKQAGIFEIRNIPDDQMQGIVSIVCPQMIYPYLRAIVSDVCTRAGFPPILLTEVNFQAMYEAQQQAQAAPGSRIITNLN